MSDDAQASRIEGFAVYDIAKDKSVCVNAMKHHAEKKDTMMNALNVLANPEDYVGPEGYDGPDEFALILEDEDQFKEELKTMAEEFKKLPEGLSCTPYKAMLGFSETGGAIGWEPTAPPNGLDALRNFLKQAGFEFDSIDDGVYAWTG